MKIIKYEYGQVINGITFIEEVPPHIDSNGWKIRKAKFRCACGEEFIARIHNAKSGLKVSCNNCGRQRTSKANSTHRLSKHPLYSIWLGMKSRCYNSNAGNYYNYGKRGIKICKEWLNNFESFYSWANENDYKPNLFIDRINNNGNYEPSNCRFVTSAENSHNTRMNKVNWDIVHEIRNAKLLLPQLLHKEIAKAYGISRSLVGLILGNKIWKEQCQL